MRSTSRVPAAVAAGHPVTAEAGRAVLAQGGSAADAAVAAVLASAVTEGMFTGLGGGGFATYFDAATQQITCHDFFVAVPGLEGDRRPGAMRELDIVFGGLAQRFSGGGASIAVPGVVAGCDALHRAYGRLPWQDVVAPAIALARDGIEMTVKHAHVLRAIEAAMVVGDGAAIWAPGGRLLDAGDWYTQPDLARALDLVAERRSACFVEGPLADALVEVTQSDGGVLDHADLRSYAVSQVPSTSAALGECAVTARRDLLEVVATVGALPADLARLSGPQRAVAMAGVQRSGPSTTPERIGETTNICVVDADGNACVVTTSLGVGAGVWVPGYGIHLNSMLGEGELLVGAPRAGDRMASMMCPLVATDADGLVLAAGAAGASRIRTALLHVLVGALVDHAEVEAAVASPRAHLAAGTVHLEPGYGADTHAALQAAGYGVRQWDHLDHYFGGASAIGARGAAGDPRRGGGAALL